MLTTKELSAIEDQLDVEQTMVAKFNSYAQNCSDQELKTKCSQIAAQHQAHFDRLLNQLN